jgi:hypothetical protein
MMHKIRYTYYFAATLVLLLMTACTGRTKQGTGADTIALSPAPEFMADSAMSYIEAQCAFGPRTPGSSAHEACGNWIVRRFQQLGAEVNEQRTELRGYDGQLLPCRNISARLNPEATDRVLLTAHWDSRAWADNDPDKANHKTPVMAANDGASGVAVMLEIARAMTTQQLDCGVDFVCFDLEDQGTPQWAEPDDSNPEIIDEGDYWCLGSRYWAEAAFASGYTARYAINLDMVGGRGARFQMEAFSLHYASPLVNMIWHLAEQIGYGDYFPLRKSGYVTDDHLPINQLARIPAVDIIPHHSDGRSSFGPTWHTVHDTPDAIDPSVLKAVGQTLLQLLYNDNAK